MQTLAHDLGVCSAHAPSPAMEPLPPLLPCPCLPLSPAAVLFGALVHHSLVSGITLGVALRYVLEVGGRQRDLAGGWGGTSLACPGSLPAICRLWWKPGHESAPACAG